VLQGTPRYRAPYSGKRGSTFSPMMSREHHWSSGGLARACRMKTNWSMPGSSAHGSTWRRPGIGICPPTAMAARGLLVVAAAAISRHLDGAFPWRGEPGSIPAGCCRTVNTSARRRRRAGRPCRHVEAARGHSTSPGRWRLAEEFEVSRVRIACDRIDRGCLAACCAVRHEAEACGPANSKVGRWRRRPRAEDAAAWIGRGANHMECGRSKCLPEKPSKRSLSYIGSTASITKTKQIRAILAAHGRSKTRPSNHNSSTCRGRKPNSTRPVASTSIGWQTRSADIERGFAGHRITAKPRRKVFGALAQAARMRSGKGDGDLEIEIVLGDPEIFEERLPRGHSLIAGRSRNAGARRSRRSGTAIWMGHSIRIYGRIRSASGAAPGRERLGRGTHLASKAKRISDISEPDNRGKAMEQARSAYFLTWLDFSRPTAGRRIYQHLADSRQPPRSRKVEEEAGKPAFKSTARAGASTEDGRIFGARAGEAASAREDQGRDPRREARKRGG